jgi:hypothetical protein
LNADCDQIDDRQTDVLAQQVVALGDKQLTALGTILVRGADDLDGRHKSAFSLDLENQDSARLQIREFGIQR